MPNTAPRRRTIPHAERRVTIAILVTALISGRSVNVRQARRLSRYLLNIAPKSIVRRLTRDNDSQAIDHVMAHLTPYFG